MVVFFIFTNHRSFKKEAVVSGQHYYGYCTLSDLIAETYSISIHAGFHPEGIILGGGGEAPGNGCGFIYFSIQLSQILGGKLTPCPPPLWMKP